MQLFIADSLSALSEKIMPFPTKICIKFQPITCLECNSTVLLLVDLEYVSRLSCQRETQCYKQKEKEKTESKFTCNN